MRLKIFQPRKYLTLFILMYCGFLQAQVHVEFGPLNEYVFNTKEALNLVVVNNNTKAFPVYIQGKIMDAAGEQVVEFKSAEVFLNTGANIITPVSTALQEINYHNSDIAEIEQRTGTYPSGNYQVCVWLVCVTDDCSGAGRNAIGMEQAKCMPVHVENPTPLILATPENDSEIEEYRPLFTWIPPSPVAGSAGLNYTMTLVEIMEGQNKSDALSQNRPLIEAEGVGNPALIFPSDLPELEPGKSYAWQVEAYVGKTPIAKSEQWKFRIKKEEKISYRYYDVDQNITEIPKFKLGEKVFFIVRNDMDHIAPVFTIRPINERKVLQCKIQRVTKDSVELEFVEYSNELYQAGLSKYALSLDAGQFAIAGIYEMVLNFNHKRTYFRFEITQ